MFVELHLIQNFAPANLNRDDTGAPKDCEFGGYRRARVSSQCLKRAIRKDAGFSRFLANTGGVRTRRLIVEVAERVAGTQPAPDATLRAVSEVFREGGIERVPARGGEGAEKDATKLILFLERPAVEEMASLFRDRWRDLTKGTAASRTAAREALGEILARAVKAPDIALFGRMIEIDAQKPFGKLHLGIDAACQVAHALSTNKVSMEFDFYTAVDDLKKPWEHAGADMLGTIEFNSACFYRYANVDLEQLKANLGGDEELARRTLDAFLRAAIAAIPTGKQNSMAAQNPPSLVLAVVREHDLWSLANAFAQPVRPNEKGDLVRNSIAALDRYWGQLTCMYGGEGIAATTVCALDGDGLTELTGARVEGVPALIARTLGAVAFRPVVAGGGA